MSECICVFERNTNLEKANLLAKTSVSGNRLFRFVFHLLAAYTAFPGLGVCVALFVHMVSWSINKSCVGVLHMQPWEGGLCI